jgi:diamine N-acetyltransferase
MPETPQPVTLREITVDTVDAVIALKVTPEQEGHVASNAKSIAQAHFYPDVAWFRAVYAGETLVGFVMLSDDAVKQEYWLWRLMIAEPYQGRGYGRQVIEQVCDYVRTRPGAEALITSVVPGPAAALDFYQKAGFVLTGELDDEGEWIMRLDL